ncbi:MAG TPA: protein kinase family protein [Terracidiphilus sp.]|nr:protein kinase family protein [Terracidiphilus sp.]
MAEIVRFLRSRDYKLIKELGQGACGKTVLLVDDQIGQHFVCKKYSPYEESERKALFENFVREIKLLHLLQHNNLVRVFNYYLYPEKFSGYILMEFVDGKDIEDFTAEFPDKLNDLFNQAIDGFSYLERSGVLHRDIRAGNLLVSNEGQLKIIDLGFGKQVNTSLDFDKSITLNWWCATPDEFRFKRYNFTTEVYFVGKLFEQLIHSNNISQFKYTDALRRMCEPDPDRRIKSFAEIDRAIRSELITETEFSDEEIETYRRFASALMSITSKIAQSAKYLTDLTKIQSKLGEIYRSSMLEWTIPDSHRMIGCFVEGGYYYKANQTVNTETVRDFVRLLKSCGAEQARVIIANLDTRLDTVKRYDPDEIQDEDIPF